MKKIWSTLVLLILLAVGFFVSQGREETGQNGRKSQEANTKGGGEASVAKRSARLARQPLTLEWMTKQFESAESLEELTTLLDRYYSLDENLTLEAWAEFDSPLYQNRETALSLHLSNLISKKYPPLEAIRTLEGIKAKKPEHYLHVGRYTLQSYSGDEQVQDIVEFLNTKDHRELSQESALSIGMNAGINKPEEYTQYLDRIQDDRVKNSLLEGLLSTWVQANPDAVAEYINTVEQTPELEASIAEIAETTSAVDPAIAMGWAESIQNNDLKNQTIYTVASHWALETNAHEIEKYTQWKATLRDPSLIQRLEDTEKNIRESRHKP